VEPEYNDLTSSRAAPVLEPLRVRLTRFGVRLAFACVACAFAILASHVIGRVGLDRWLVGYCVLFTVAIELVGWFAVIPAIVLSLFPKPSGGVITTVNFEVLVRVVALSVPCYLAGVALARVVLRRWSIEGGGAGAAGIGQLAHDPSALRAQKQAARFAATDPMVRRLISVTQQAWRDGRVPQMSTLPPTAQKALRTMAAYSDEKFFHTIDKLVGVMLASVATGGQGFEAEEVLVGYIDGNYLMTTRAIYFFEQGKKTASTKVVLLQDILDYSRERPGEARVVLRSGERISARVKGLVPAESFVKSFLVAPTVQEAQFPAGGN